MTHAWCHDIARDASVRAAEDNRTGPLPTLGEAISAPFRHDTCQMCHGAGFVAERGTRGRFICDLCNGTGGGPRTASASSAQEHENKGDGMSGSTWFPASEQPAPAAPFAEAAKCSSTVSKTGEGQSGMRTERITLEVTHNAAFSAREWRMWRTIFDPRYGESVRVVHEPKLAPDANDDGGSNHAAPAASGGGEATYAPIAIEGFPVRTMPDIDPQKAPQDVAFTRQQREAVHLATSVLASIWHEGKQVYGDTLEVLRSIKFDSPPQPRGWLTGEEREIIAGITDDDEYTEEGQNIAKGLLARSTPPEVVLPDWVMMCVSHDRQNQLRKALAAAGVAVKEVGK